MADCSTYASAKQWLDMALNISQGSPARLHPRNDGDFVDSEKAVVKNPLTQWDGGYGKCFATMGKG